MANPIVDYKKIKLENERSTHLTKKLNRLSTWQFFKVLYRNDMFKIILMNLLMMVFIVPAVLVWLFCYSSNAGLLAQQLPNANVIGIGTNVWLGVGAYYSEQLALINNTTHLWWILAFCALAFAFSGGMAIVRDAFWTGRVKVFKTFFVGIGQSIAYTFTGTLVLSAAFYGLYALQTLLMAVLPSWLAIIILVIGWIIFALMAIYMYTLFAVATTYKQSFVNNVTDAWRILWLNFLPNMFSFIIGIAPFILYFMLTTGTFTMLLLAVFFMFGMFYLVFVYMTNMMKTFALFHPVERKKGNDKSSSTTPATPTPAKAN